MVTAVTEGAALQIAGRFQPEAQQQSLLSDFAQEALGSLSQMHNNFAASYNAVQAPTPAANTHLTAAERMSADLQQVNRTMQATQALQAQLVQFSMATHMSSSVGSNLNTFLKSQ